MASLATEIARTRHLETFLHTTPLGISCVDIVTRSPVTTGIRITARAVGGRGRPITAFATRSGVYGLEGLPGLRDFEYSPDGFAATGAAITSPPGGREFAIQIEDMNGRFLPWGVALTAPRRDIFKAWLFSSPSRPPVPGLALIRGSLVDASQPATRGRFKPASYARIEAQVSALSPPDGFVALADARGQFALLMPYPSPLKPPAGGPVLSPHTPGRKTVAENSWPLTIRFHYAPSRQRFICARPDGRIEVIQGQRAGITDGNPPEGWRCVPELTSLLTQPQSNVLPSSGSNAAAPSIQVDIKFARETVIRSSEGDSDLRIAPQ